MRIIQMLCAEETERGRVRVRPRLASSSKVPLSSTGNNESDLEMAMPQVNCSLCCRMDTGIKYTSSES